jgi:hypothetical protein
MRAADARIGVLLAALGAAAAWPLAAQSTDPPRAPRILDVPRASVPEPPTASAAAVEPRDLRVSLPAIDGERKPPNAARLAPLPEDRRDGTEEIVVIGQGWRLPDLGSEWRAHQKETEDQGRFSATALPLYDPGQPPQHSDAFTAGGEERRHGYIELFRLRFGRRTTD